MTSLTFIALSASVMALLSSIGAWFAIGRLLRQFRSSSAEKQSRRLTDLENTLEELAATIKNLRSRLNMQAYRERKAAAAQTATEIDPEADAEETRRDLNAQLARGELKVMR